MHHRACRHAANLAILLTLASLAGCAAGTGGGAGAGGDAPDGFIDPDEAIAATTPAAGDTEVAPDAPVAITFTRSVVPASLDVWIEPDADLAEAWSQDDTVLTLTPAAPLEAGTVHTVYIGDLTLTDGAELSEEFSFSFTTTAGGETGPLGLAEVRYWGYQIQSLDEDGAIDALAESPYDLLVLEPTRTDAGSADFDTRAMVERLKATTAADGAHRKLIIAYVDIGEAEDWRWYWTWSTEPEDQQVPGDADLPEDWPDYIVARDPDGWVGNYPVAYWDPDWKDIIIYGENHSATAQRDYTSALDELLLDGFDGIYLDWVEGFENEQVIAAARAEGLDAAQEMSRFIAEIRDYARQRNPDFLVIQQNAAALAGAWPDSLNHIDAIAQEGVWYDGVAGDDWDDTDGYFTNTTDLTEEYLALLAGYLDAGLPVFNCEYSLAELADDAYSRSNEAGYVPYVTRRALSRLTDTPPPALRNRARQETAGRALRQTPAQIAFRGDHPPSEHRAPAR